MIYEFKVLYLCSSWKGLKKIFQSWLFSERKSHNNCTKQPFGNSTKTILLRQMFKNFSACTLGCFTRWLFNVLLTPQVLEHMEITVQRFLFWFKLLKMCSIQSNFWRFFRSKFAAMAAHWLHLLSFNSVKSATRYL